MINTLRAEFIKLRTVLVHWVLAIDRGAVPDRRDDPRVDLRERSTAVDVESTASFAGLIVGLTVVVGDAARRDVGDQPHVGVRPQHDPTDVRGDTEPHCR